MDVHIRELLISFYQAAGAIAADTPQMETAVDNIAAKSDINLELLCNPEAGIPDNRETTRIPE